MNSYLTLFGILLIGFVVYFYFRDTLFAPEPFYPPPSPVSMEPSVRLSPSGPNPPSQAPPEGEVIQYPPPSPSDPFHESEESAEHPERLRHPERAYRPSPPNETTAVAVQSGIASEHLRSSGDASQMYEQEMIQGGGEFMPGIYANDTFTDVNYTAF